MAMKFYACTTDSAVLYLLALIFVSSGCAQVTALVDGAVENYHILNVTPTVIVGSAQSNDFVRCARVPVSGLSRLKLGSYSSALRISLVPFKEIQEKWHSKIQICLHSNSSIGLCQCEKDNWESMQNGIWSYAISPYENRYIDVKFSNNLSGSITVELKLEFQRWRLACLGIGLVVLLLAPIVSAWVPFYYSSSMAIGICLVIIIVLFQGMKLLPTGRKNALYSTICGIALGAGSFLLNRLSMFVNSILVNFGFGEELHNPILVFLAVGVILCGAGFGYWLVRKFVVVEDGSVDDGIAQFVKWALRVIAVTFIFQSTLDTPLAIGLLVSFLGIYCFITFTEWDGFWDYKYNGNGSPQRWSSQRTNKKHNRTEFLSKSGTTTSRETLWQSSRNIPVGLSAMKGTVSVARRRRPRNSPTYYSTFHKTPDRRKFSEEDWKDFTEESTRQAVAGLTSSPEFTEWIMNNADRIQFQKSDSSEESIGSGSDSTDDNPGHSSSHRAFLPWERNTQKT